MKRFIPFLFITLSALSVAAEKAPRNKYSLSVARVYEAAPERPEWVFIVGGTSVVRGGETVCRSAESLKKLIGSLPRGSTLDWWPTCSGESEALANDLEEMKRVCREAGVEFTIHPAG
jgi:hypothetical protein